jgi:hypothetical protein
MPSATFHDGIDTNTYPDNNTIFNTKRNSETRNHALGDTVHDTDTNGDTGEYSFAAATCLELNSGSICRGFAARTAGRRQRLS